MSSEQTLNEEKSTRKTRRKRDKVDLSNKEGKNVKKKEKENYCEQQSSLQQMKSLPEPIIYDPSNNSNQQRNLPLAADDSNIQDEQRQITTDAKEIAEYYLTFHKNMINTYNSIYYQILQGISNSYNNGLFTVNERFTEYSFEIENMYRNLISNKRDKSLKLIDDVITENLDTFIKSIKFTQKFYNDIIQSYLDCIRK